MDAETLTGGLEKAKYSKDVTKIFQRCHQSIPKMSPKYSKDVTKILHFSAHKNIYWCFFMPNFSFMNSLLKRPKVSTHLDRVVFTIIINFQKSKTFKICQENLANFSWHIMNVFVLNVYNYEIQTVIMYNVHCTSTFNNPIQSVLDKSSRFRTFK